MKIIKISQPDIVIFTAVKNRSLLHGHVIVMSCYQADVINTPYHPNGVYRGKPLFPMFALKHISSMGTCLNGLDSGY